MTKKPTTLHVPLSAATLVDIAADFERRAAEAANDARLRIGATASLVAAAESRTWEQAARILRSAAAARKP